MDVLKHKKHNAKRKVGYVAGIFAVAATCFYLISFAGDLSLQVDQHKVQIASVEYGDLEVKVSAFGKIKSSNINVVSNDVDGIVTEVLVQSGDFVEQGQTLLQLTNLELRNIVDELSWGLEELESQHQELLLKNKAVLIQEELTLFEIQKQLNISQLNLEAQDKLIQLDNAVSKITFEETKLTYEMLQRQYSLAKSKFSHLKQQLASTRDAHQAKINKNKKILARAQKQVEALTVKAGFSGYLDQFEAEVGQQLAKGQKVARIIGESGFYAELNVPEYNIDSVSVGQNTFITVRHEILEGRVSRVSPSVVDGSVKVNVELSPGTNVPRLEQAVEGQIITQSIPSTYFVKKPIYARENLTTMAFVSTDTGSLFNKNKVSFGHLSDEYIEIRSGVNLNDKILISDISEYSAHEQIDIN